MLSINLLSDPEIPLLCIYLREMKMCVYTKICLWMFMAALSIMAQKGKQFKCPLTGKCAHKHGVHTRECYSPIKEWVPVHATVWTNLRNVKLSGRRHRRPHMVWFMHRKCPREGEFHEMKIKYVVVWSQGDEGVTADGWCGFFLGMVTIF